MSDIAALLAEYEEERTKTHQNWPPELVDRLAAALRWYAFPPVPMHHVTDTDGAVQGDKAS